jgi:UDP-galactopyranose mutase
VGVRWDDDPYLFRDRFQGWPAGAGGYTDLIDALLDDDRIVVRVRSPLSLSTLPDALAREAADGVVLTCPLDTFCDGRLGQLQWRGIAVRSVHVPHIDLAQAATVVNYPALEYPFIRVHETKHASRQACAGTVLSFEFPGAPARHYPVEGPETRALNDRYMALVRDRVGAAGVRFAGRLATYRYLDMDDCMREALDCGEELVSDPPRLRAARRAGPRGGRT